MRHGLLIFSLPFFSGLVLAQDQEKPVVMTPALIPVWQKHAVAVQGSSDSQAIPYGVAMERVFWDFASRASASDAFRQYLQTLFPVTEADVHLITDVASHAFEFSATVRNDALARYDELCMELVSAPQLEAVDAVGLAARFDAIERQQADLLTAHYRKAVDGLSPAARAGIDAYIDGKVRTKLEWGHDLVGLASEVPQAFLAQRKEVCDRNLKTPISQRQWQHVTNHVVISSAPKIQ
jgi:hypothetical protein